MRRPNPIRRMLGRRRRNGSTAKADAARRAMRARDHLERKRAQERRRRQRERAQADQRDRRSPVRGALSLGLFAIAVIVGTYAATPLNDRRPVVPATLDHVDVQGASVLSAEEVVARVRLPEPSDGRGLKVQDIVDAVEAEPWIESARAMQLPTGALMISVVERNAIAVWRRDTTSPPLLIDRTGEPFGGAIEPGGPLPNVAGATRTQGAPLPAEALEILTAIAHSTSLSEDPRALTLHLPTTSPVAEATDAAPDGLESAAGYVLQLGAEGPRALLGRRLFSERVARLAALVESEEPTFLGARWIDLRYADRAVLRTEPVSG